MAFLGGGHYGVLTVGNICILTIANNVGIWLVLVNALYGVGALIAPQVISFFSI